MKKSCLFWSNNIEMILKQVEKLLETRSNKWISARNKIFTSKPTFTPFANREKCPAHCHYCSEDLKLKNQQMNSSPKFLIKNEEKYIEGLKKCIQYIEKNFGKLQFSFSGLEATVNPQFYDSVMKTVLKNDVFTEKVLYTNGSGIVKHQVSLDSIDKIELHRDHFDEELNQKLMRFEKRYMFSNKEFSNIMLKHSNIWLVSILNKVGCNKFSEVKKYLDWASGLGVKGVIFRELSKFESSIYDLNYTFNWVNQNRVPVEEMLTAVLSDQEFEFKKNKIGYYYYNEEYLYKGITVVFEESNYEILNELEEQKKIHKLVYFSNGNLCNGWNQNQNVIQNFIQ
jgi:MoaA/NifB/PqqE/SkfB family radical SAM enzyme